MKEIRDEGLRSPERFGSWPEGGSAFWREATSIALNQVRGNLPAYPPGLYPAPASRKLRYPAIENTEWTSSFWCGILWLAYELSGDAGLREAALARIPDFRRRLDERIAVETHDLGFLSTACPA
jgi:unsaturated chondroitin disaccharide hydrolase